MSVVYQYARRLVLAADQDEPRLEVPIAPEAFARCLALLAAEPEDARRRVDFLIAAAIGVTVQVLDRYETAAEGP